MASRKDLLVIALPDYREDNGNYNDECNVDLVMSGLTAIFILLIIGIVLLAVLFFAVILLSGVSRSISVRIRIIGVKGIFFGVIGSFIG